MRFSSLKFICAWLSLLGFVVEANGKSELPAGGTLAGRYQAGQSIGFYSGTFEGKPVGAYEEVAVEHPDFDVALRVTVSNPSGNFWTGGGRIGIATGARKGDVGLVRMYMRTIKTLAETGSAVATVFVQGPSNEKSFVRSMSADKEWTEFLIPFEFAEDYQTGDVNLFFGMGAGQHAQSYELAGFEVYYYGRSLTVDDLPETALTYAGREVDASWRAAAAQRIEANRKGGFSVRLVDADGIPIPYTSIQTVMTRHAFEFGSAFSTFAITEDSADGETLREKTVELFNSGGPFNHMKWKALAGDFGPTWTEEKLIEALTWMKEQGLAMRGHVLVWPARSHLPKFIGDLIPDNPAGADPSIKDYALAHIDSITTATKDLVSEWDVVNEPYDNHDLMDAFGDDVMLDWFARARQNLPEHRLYLNDYNILSTNTSHQNHYEQTLRYLTENGAPITGMGMQGHYGESPTGIQDIENALLRYVTAFPNLDVRVTEFSIDTKDEQLQGDFLRDFYTLLFSYPQVVGIQQWGFWAATQGDNKGMYDYDWREKPAAVEYKKLVLGDWWSSFAGRTDRDGRFSERGFYGDYEARVTVAGVGYSLPFTVAADQVEWVLDLPIRLAEATADYEAWAEEQFSAEQLADTDLSSPDGDVDGDGMSNLFEYTFQLQNEVADLGPFQSIEFDSQEGAWRLQHLRTTGASNLILILEVSNDLLHWDPVDAVENVTVELGRVVVETRIPLNLNVGSREFLRFRVIEGE